MPARPTIARIERAFAAGWPALETERVGAWEARLSEGFTRRANAIQCYDAADDGDAPSRLARLETRYRAHGLTPLFRVTPLTGRADYAHLLARGWRFEGDSLVLDRPLQPTPRYQVEGVVAARPTDEGWMRGQIGLHGCCPGQAEAFSAFMARLPAQSAGLTLMDEGRPVASALAVVVKSIAVFVNVVTGSEHRRCGLGTRLMRAALGWARENGAQHAALQVEAHNGPALAHYRGLGFAFRYPYHYRRAPEGRA